MAAVSDTAKDLVVYIIGISGKCSKNYIGCGKSCLCRQYIYNEYVEESSSTLLQSEFDGCVINQQHVIYWGKKEETYKEMTKGQCSFEAKVNFEVFEHTIFYQDGANQPFHGYEKYEKRIFTHLKSYLGKYAFKSRDEVLNPEDYDSKKFSYSHIVPVAYLYVVDVSQSCCVFEEQMQLMSTLVKSIQIKKQSCVVVASKFDTYCQTYVERLESLASKLKVPVVQCSAKDDTNIDTAFKYLAMKTLSLKKLSVNVLTHAEVAVQERAKTPTKDEQDDINIDIIPHVSMANRSLSVTQDPAENRYTLWPIDYLKNSTYILTGNSDDDSSENGNKEEKKSEATSNPEVTDDYEIEHTYDSLYATDGTTTPAELSDSEEHANKYKRSTMPLPRTPLENSLLSESPSIYPVPANSEIGKTNFDELSSSDVYEQIDFGSPNTENPQGKSLALTHTESNKLKSTQKDSQDHVEERELSVSDELEGYVIEHIDFTSSVTGKDTQDSVQGDKESEGYVIEQIDFEHPVTGKMQSPYLQLIGTSSMTVEDNNEPKYYECCEQNPLPIAPVAATTKSDASVQHFSAHQISKSHDRNIKSMDTNDTVALNEESTCNVTRRPTAEIEQSVVPEFRHTDSSTSNYIYMYEVNDPSSKRDSNIYTYAYVCHSHIQMYKHRRRSTGVPPRRVKRTEHHPSIHADINPVKEHRTSNNFKITQKHTISLPPRGKPKMPTPQQPTDYKPPIPPRNIPRPECYLSAPSAVPERTQ